MSCRFILLTEEHLEQILRIERRSFSNPWAAADFRRAFGDPAAQCLGIVQGEKVVGYAIGYLTGGDLHLVNLAVAPESRRKGWASQLLAEIFRTARRQGCQRCTLEVRAGNQGAIQFYRQHGFQQREVRPNFYCRPREDALVMSRAIDEF